MIDSIVSSGTDLDMFITTFQKIFHHLITAALIIQSDINKLTVFCFIPVSIDRHDRLFDQLINLFTVVTAERDRDHAIYIPACHHLENLFDIFCGIYHQIITVFLYVLFYKSDDLPIKRITQNRIFKFFMIIDDHRDQLRLLIVQYAQSSLLHVPHFLDQCFNFPDRSRRYFFGFSVNDIGNRRGTDTCFFCYSFDRCQKIISILSFAEPAVLRNRKILFS